ncbi:MAG: hypothetical protein IK043_01385 [Candidatus Methanomethylophilaceae archaeon]|nr:hypothetical protein [Candidatus Methanomethylophilaceae archaeon]
MTDHIAVYVAVLVVLVASAVSDWRCREASDVHWMIIMGIGCVLFAVRLYDSGESPAAYAAVVSMVLMAADLLWDRSADAKVDLALYVLIIAAAVIGAFALRYSDLLWTFVSMPAMYLLMNALYYSGAVKGGADAKAIIAISFACPSYPCFGGMPFIDVPGGSLPLFVIPGFSVFLLAALITVFLAVPYAVTNIVRGDTVVPNMFAGFRMVIDRAERSHVWPMEDFVDGQVKTMISGSEDPGVYERLRAAGAERVWVTPIIPFLIPITVAYAIVVFLGNPLFLLT